MRLDQSSRSVPEVDVTDLSGGRWAPRRLQAILRWEGLRGVVGRALALLGWERYLVFVRGLDELVAPSMSMPLVDITELGPDDAERYAALRPGGSSLFRDRLRAGYACFAVWQAGRIVAVTWVVVGAVRIEGWRRTYLLDPDEIFLRDSFTAAEQRGQRLSAALFATIAATYRDRGYRRAICLVAPHNRSSLRSHERSGFRRIGAVSSFPMKPNRTADFESVLTTWGDGRSS
jgi:GNAT superfamily N-acetyltransferase